MISACLPLVLVSYVVAVYVILSLSRRHSEALFVLCLFWPVYLLVMLPIVLFRGTRDLILDK